MQRERWLVDGMNVLGSRPDGWWRDRDAAVLRLVAQLRTFAVAGGREVTVVFHGRPLAELAEGTHEGVTVRYAPVADERVIHGGGGQGPGLRWRVVTSDRRLRERVAALSAEVEGAGAFVRRLDS